MLTVSAKPTAAQLVLLAAAGIEAEEFTEWELTVACWKMDPERFGMRGFEDKYPDHKRVAMELMGAKPSNPVQQRFMAKVRPNVYRVTPLGRVAAGRLSPKCGHGSQANTSGEVVYANIRRLLETPEFRRWRDAPGPPDDAPACGRFIGRDSLARVKDTIRAAVDTCKAAGGDFLKSPARPKLIGFHVKDIADLWDFCIALEHRFPEVCGCATTPPATTAAGPTPPTCGGASAGGVTATPESAPSTRRTRSGGSNGPTSSATRRPG